MIIYLLKSATCSGLLLAFYFLVLEREKMHNFNRFYLLGSILFSFLAPLCIISIEATPVIIESMDTSTTFCPTENIVMEEIVIEKPIDYQSIILILYGIISSILLTRFGRNLFHIIKKIRKNVKIKYHKAVLVLVDDDILPHTFWNYIFIKKNDYENKKIEQELFTHELTHVTQKHTIDVLILELLQCIFWINPFFILLKKAMQLNHEFLADEKVIHQHKNTIQYQHLLLNKTAWKNEYYLASNLNYSLTKKRLKMMTTQSSATKILLKKLAVIPLLAGFVFLFAERVEAQEIIEIREEPREIKKETKEKESDDTYIEIVEGESSTGKSEPEYHYTKQIFWIKNEKGKKIAKKYFELSEKDKKVWLLFPKNNYNKNKISHDEFSILQNSDIYVVRIDGNLVENSELSKYKAKDFVSYGKREISKLAKLKQKYHYNLITKSGFEILEVLKKSLDAQKRKYNIPSSNGSKQSFPFKKDDIIDIREKLKNVTEVELIDSNNRYPNTGFKLVRGIMFYYVTIDGKTKFYNQEGKPFDKNGKLLSNKKAKASEIMPENYVKKIFYKGEVFCEFVDDKTLKNKTKLDSIIKQKKASKEEMQEYKKLILETEKNTVIKVKTLNKLKAIYKSMSEEQQYSVKNIDVILSKLPPPANMDTIFTYKRLADRIERTSKNRAANIIYLKSLYNKMNENEKLIVHSPDKIISRLKRQKIASNATTLKLIEKLAKKDAKFYFENKQISAKKALKLVQENNILVESESMNNSNYLVKLYKNYSKKDSKIRLEEIKEKFQKGNNNSNDNQLDEIIKMVKQGAKFYYEKEPITSDKAIEIFKKNKKLNIHSEGTNNNKYRVFISKNNNKEKPKTIPSSFRKRKDKQVDLVFNNLELIKKEKELYTKLNEYEKKQYLLRKTIIQATTLKAKNFNFKIDGKSSNINDVYEFIYNNPVCGINTLKVNENLITLNLKINKTNQMTNIDLQNVYSKVFERTK